jgi:hypothetical protein
MFRKIHSNRDPKDTLLSEFRKEFGCYFRAFGDISSSIMERRPRVTFAVMVALLTASLIISFTFFRHRDKPKSMAVPVKVSPVRDGISEIIIAGEKLKKTMALKNLVDSLTSKKMLTAKDSSILDSALDRLQSIQKSNN